MPIYNAPILKIDAAEVRRYAGLRKAENFDEKNIFEACEEALIFWKRAGFGKFTITIAKAKLSFPSRILKSSAIRL